MSKSKTRRARKRKPTYINSVISISLVLFILGMLLTAVLQGQRLSNYIKESFLVEVELRDSANESEIMGLVSQLNRNAGTKDVQFVSKENALNMLKAKLGEEYVDILAYNPLYNSIQLHLKADWVVEDSIKAMEDSLLAFPIVARVDYPAALMQRMNKNLSRLMILVAGFGLVLFLIAIALIDSTIRLAMFSDRFLIRSMQLVGATRWFVVKPFVYKGIYNGLISGLIASIAIVGSFLYLEQANPELSVLEDLLTFAIVIGLVLGTGVLISLLSTHMAVSKYLGMKLDDLY